MLDRHAAQELLRAGVKPRAVAQQFRVSRRTIERIAGEEKIRSAADGILCRDGSDGERGVGRPRVTEAIRAQVQALVLEDPDRPPGEICRLLKEDGTPLGLSTVYRVLAAVRATIPATLQVRFEGVAGEFAQFDFGEVSVRLTDGSRRTVHFAAYRLKYSRWMHVVLVPNERVEALIRSLLDSFEASGGVPPVARIKLEFSGAHKEAQQLRQPAGDDQTPVDVLAVVEQRRRDAYHAIPHCDLDLRRIECCAHSVGPLGRIERHDRRPIPHRREEPMSLIRQAVL